MNKSGRKKCALLCEHTEYDIAKSRADRSLWEVTQLTLSLSFCM